VVEDGVNGFLVRFGDLPALTDRLTRLLADPALRARFGGAGRRLVAERYIFEQYRVRLLNSLSGDLTVTVKSAGPRVAVQ
jgi:glycosyltransferase involved in cell wall biosynthesis